MCDGVICLQLLYGAVVYRAQHTIHHVLGDLSITKQLSRELSTPVTPYTGNNLIEVISSTVTGITDDTDSNVTDDRSEIETPRADSGGRSDNTVAMERTDIRSNVDVEASPSVESKNSESDSKPTESNHESKESSNKPTNLPESTAQAENTVLENTRARVTRLVPQTSEESVDTPTDSADGGVTTDETYSTDISEVLRAVYPDLSDDIDFVSEDDDDDTEFTDDMDRGGVDDNNATTAGVDNQQFFIRFIFDFNTETETF